MKLCVYMEVKTWYDGDDDHVEHVVQQESNRDGDEDKFSLIFRLLERIPPLLPVLSYGFISQPGDPQVVDAHFVYYLSFFGLNVLQGREGSAHILPTTTPGSSPLIPANKINIQTKLEISMDVTKETTGVHVTTPPTPPSPPRPHCKIRTSLKDYPLTQGNDPR